MPSGSSTALPLLPSPSGLGCRPLGVTWDHCRRAGGCHASGSWFPDRTRLPAPTRRHPSVTPDLESPSALIRPLLEEAIGGQTDIGVDTRSRPSTSHCCVLSTPQVPDRHPAPNREVAYVQECILARPELVGRLCRCRTCVQHSTLARRRMGAQSTTRPPPLCFVSLPIQREPSSNFGERQILRQLQSTTPSSVVCLCTCYVCVGHRTLDFAAESLVRRASPSPPEAGGCRDQRDQRDCTTTH